MTTAPATARHLRRSALTDRAAELAAASSGAVMLAEVPFLAMTDLRLDPTSPAAPAAVAALGTALPGPGEVTDYGDRAVLWLAPDEFLVVGPDGDLPLYLPALREALDGHRGSAVDVSANRTTIAVTGPSARALLGKGLTVDLHPRVFPTHRCAATTLARTLVIVRHTTPDAYHLLVRPSFANYLADWLIDAATEYALAT